MKSCIKPIISVQAKLKPLIAAVVLACMRSCLLGGAHVVCQCQGDGSAPSVHREQCVEFHIFL